MTQVYQEFARKIMAQETCRQSNNTQWYEEHTNAIDDLTNTYLCLGSGFQKPSNVYGSFDAGKLEYFVIETQYLKYDEFGMRGGYVDLTIWVEPHLLHKFTLHIRVLNPNEITLPHPFHDPDDPDSPERYIYTGEEDLDYFHEIFFTTLSQPYFTKEQREARHRALHALNESIGTGKPITHQERINLMNVLNVGYSHCLAKFGHAFYTEEPMDLTVKQNLRRMLQNF
jgi:hypothetical protein